MYENKHTPEPWRTDAECGFPQDIHDSKGNLFLRCASDFDNEIYGEANARRITACVNACAGCATEVLETAPVGFFNSTYGHPKYLEEITKQCDELNRLCEFNEKTMQFLLDVINYIVDEAKLTSSQYELCRQAIACVIGEQ